MNCAPGSCPTGRRPTASPRWPNNTAWYGDTYYYRTLETFKTLEIGGAGWNSATPTAPKAVSPFTSMGAGGKSDSYRQSQGFPTQTTGLVSGMNPATQQPGNGATYWYPVPQAVAVVVDPAASPVAVWGYVHPDQAHWYGSGSPQTPRDLPSTPSPVRLRRPPPSITEDAPMALASEAPLTGATLGLGIVSAAQAVGHRPQVLALAGAAGRPVGPLLPAADAVLRPHRLPSSWAR